MEQLGIKNDITKLQQLLGSKLYSDKYSFISEILQNSTDAMRKCGKGDETFNIGISFNSDASNFIFYVRDFGCSFDTIEDFKRLVGTLLESSKTQSKNSSENQEIGKFGIGSISVAAYNSEWFYKIYKNGKGFDAKLMEIEGKGLFLECSEYYDTDEVDGVYFQVILKDRAYDFYKNLVKKARYFQNINFQFDGPAIANLKMYDSNIVDVNELFKIYRNDLFQYSTLNKLEDMHICIDQYSYLIRWDILGIDSIKLPIALRFNLDDFETNPTREVITITDDYKDKVLGKIGEVADWFANKYNEHNPEIECSNLKKFVDEVSKRSRKHIAIDQYDFDIARIVKEHGTVKLNRAKFKNITKKDVNHFEDFMKQNYNNYYSFYLKIDGRQGFRKGSINYNVDHILIEGSLKRSYQDYLKSNFGDKFVFIKKTDRKLSFMRSTGFGSYQAFLNKDNDEMQEFGVYEMYEKIVFLKEQFDEYVLRKVSDVFPPDIEEIVKKTYAPTTRKSKSVDKTDEDIILKYPRRPDRYISWNAVWEDKAVKFSELRKQPKFHIYGEIGDRQLLETFYINFNNVQTIMVTEKSKKMLDKENLHNFVSIDSIKNDFTLISKYATAAYIAHKVKDIKYLFENQELINNHISTGIGNDIKVLKDLMVSYDIDDVFWRSSGQAIVKEIINFYENNPKMYNQDMLEKLNNVLKVADKLDFIQFINASTVKDNPSALKTIRDICRFRQLRMNWENYNLDKISNHFQPVIASEVLETV